MEETYTLSAEDIAALRRALNYALINTNVDVEPLEHIDLMLSTANAATITYERG